MGASQTPTLQSGANLQTFRRVITSPELLSGFSSPVNLIDAPGAGNIIDVIGNPVLKYNFGTTAYTINTGVQLIYDQLTPVNRFTASNLIGFSNDRIIVGSASVVSADYDRIENLPLRFRVSNGDPGGGGDGEVEVFFLYQILTI